MSNVRSSSYFAHDVCEEAPHPPEEIKIREDNYGSLQKRTGSDDCVKVGEVKSSASAIATCDERAFIAHVTNELSALWEKKNVLSTGFSRDLTDSENSVGDEQECLQLYTNETTKAGRNKRATPTNFRALLKMHNGGKYYEETCGTYGFGFGSSTFGTTIARNPLCVLLFSCLVVESQTPLTMTWYCNAEIRYVGDIQLTAKMLKIQVWPPWFFLLRWIHQLAQAFLGCCYRKAFSEDDPPAPNNSARNTRRERICVICRYEIHSSRAPEFCNICYGEICETCVRCGLRHFH